MGDGGSGLSIQGIVEEQDESDSEEPDESHRPKFFPGLIDGPTAKVGRPVSPKYAAVGFALIIVFVVIAFMWVQSVQPPSSPVDVYSKPSPPEGTQMLSIFPSTVLGNPCTEVKCQNGTGVNVTDCTYGGGIIIEVRNYSYESGASGSLDSSRTFYESNSYNVTHYESEEERWFCLSGTDVSIFAWQKDIWVFEIFAPDDATRNSVAALLPY